MQFSAFATQLSFTLKLHAFCKLQLFCSHSATFAPVFSCWTLLSTLWIELWCRAPNNCKQKKSKENKQRTKRRKCKNTLPTIVIMKTEKIKSKDKEKEVGLHSCMGRKNLAWKGFMLNWGQKCSYAPHQGPLFSFVSCLHSHLTNQVNTSFRSHVCLTLWIIWISSLTLVTDPVKNLYCREER